MGDSVGLRFARRFADRKDVSAASQKPPSPHPSGGSRAWMGLLVAAVLAITATEAILLELGGTFFSSGYNNANVDTPALIGGFFASSLLVDTFLVLLVWLVAIPLFSRLPGGLLNTFVLVAVTSLGVPGLHDLLRYRLFAVLGRMASIGNLVELAGGDASVIATEMALQLEGAIPFAVVALAGLVLLVWISQRAERRWPGQAARLAPPPRLRRVALGCAVAALAGAVVFALPSDGAARIQKGLVAKPGGQLLVQVIRRATDVDLDGFGLLSRPPDPAPFDGSIHPFALDLPGNGIDENGVAGDHPPGFEPVPVEAAALDESAPKRHLLVILLESFRADLLDAHHAGREVTPFINRLAREGARTQHAWVHTPSTVASRAQLFGGDVEWQRSGSSWVDDFKTRGYRVAHFSGQDDHLSGSAAYMGTDRVDVYYDARRDEGLRTSRTRNTLALQVSWKTLSERVEAFLAEHDPDTPLFLYVNLVDTHFPYHHDQLDDILGVTPIARHAITRARADQVRATYANAAANVDRGVERIVNAWWERLGRSGGGVLVTADHGQSFYENGVLGHGQFLDASHTRVPFVAWGMGGRWPEPLGLADVRALVRRNLPLGEPGEVPRPTFVPDPDRWIFQYGPRLERPRNIQLRALDHSVEYVLAPDRTRLEGSFQGVRHADEAEGAFEERMTHWVVRNWEAQQLRGAHIGDGS